MLDPTQKNPEFLLDSGLHQGNNEHQNAKFVNPRNRGKDCSQKSMSKKHCPGLGHPFRIPPL
jgi:hypothetical protein